MSTINRMALGQRLTRVGEIRPGHQLPVLAKNGEQLVKNGRPVYRPARLKTWRLTTDEHTARAAAEVYGGTPRPWENGPREGAWELFTDAAALHVIVLPDDSEAVRWGWERWVAGGRTHLCDGTTCQVTTVVGKGTPDEHAVTAEQPCECADLEEPLCQSVTRLRVLLPLVSGVGEWRLATGSVHAAMELRGTLEVLRLSGTRGAVPAYLELAYREVRRIGEKPKVFPVPTLKVQAPMALGLPAGAFRDDTWTQARAHLEAQHTAPQLGAGDRPALPAQSDTTPPIDAAAEWLAVLEAMGGDFDAAVSLMTSLGLQGESDLSDPDNLELVWAAVRGVDGAA